LEKSVFFDENLFMYYDEADLGFQLRSAGLEALVEPRVRVRHKNKAKHFNPTVEYFLQRNRLYMIRKHGAWYHKLLFGAYLCFCELPLKFIVRGAQGRFAFLRAACLGLWDGLAGRMGRGRRC
jgi:GT2 family glycosyltransferase